jgi:hypothetical protein
MSAKNNAKPVKEVKAVKASEEVKPSGPYEPSEDEITALVRQSLGGINRGMARTILISRHG